MPSGNLNTVIVGGGQAGLAMSKHLKASGVPHVVLERDQIAQAWRTSRWDSLVANGPAWHDRFPDKEFGDVDGDAFASKVACTRYFEEYAQENDLPIQTGVTVTHVRPDDGGYRVTTDKGRWVAKNVVAATGPFQIPVIPPLVPHDAPVHQIHSQDYSEPDALPEGGVLVIGAGSSGSQIADELLRSGRDTYLAVGPHDRPPRRYRGQDFCYWLGVLGKWEMKTPPAGREHVTIAVSGAYGGHTIDFRNFAARGMHLLGMADRYADGTLHFKPDLEQNIKEGDANHLALLEEADAYVEAQGLGFPPEEDAKRLGPMPNDATDPTLSLDLKGKGISTIIWATGYRQDFSWLDVDTFDDKGTPLHTQGIAKAPGIYFLGLPWLSMRGSSFIWGVYVDAERLAKHIASDR